MREPPPRIRREMLLTWLLSGPLLTTATTREISEDAKRTDRWERLYQGSGRYDRCRGDLNALLREGYIGRSSLSPPVEWLHGPRLREFGRNRLAKGRSA